MPDNIFGNDSTGANSSGNVDIQSIQPPWMAGYKGPAGVQNITLPASQDNFSALGQQLADGGFYNTAADARSWLNNAFHATPSLYYKPVVPTSATVTPKTTTTKKPTTLSKPVTGMPAYRPPVVAPLSRAAMMGQYPMVKAQGSPSYSEGPNAGKPVMVPWFTYRGGSR